MHSLCGMYRGRSRRHTVITYSLTLRASPPSRFRGRIDHSRCHYYTMRVPIRVSARYVRKSFVFALPPSRPAGRASIPTPGFRGVTNETEERGKQNISGCEGRCCPGDRQSARTSPVSARPRVVIAFPSDSVMFQCKLFIFPSTFARAIGFGRAL